MQVTIYQADCLYQSSNCNYPHKVVVTAEQDMAKVIGHDHVCAEYENGYRSKDTFIVSDNAPMDCDNDHSDDPEEWITPEKLDAILQDVAYILVFSRSHMKPKNGKTARPRFHVYFPIHVISDAEGYAALKRRIYAAFPFFDGNALDAARFLYGSPGSKVQWHEGGLMIDDYLTLIAKASIPQGQRNATMSHYAGRILKRLGVTDKAYQKFLEKAQECDPPLDDEELDKIWASACKFYRKIAASPDYIPPDEYTGDSLKPDDFSDIGEARTFAAVYEGEVCYTEATGFLRNNEIYWMESRQRPIAAMMEHTDAQLEEAGKLIELTLDRLEDLGIPRGAAMAGGKKLLEAMTSEQAAAYGEYVNAKSYYAFVMKCRNMKGLKAAMEAAMPLLEKQPDELDSNPFLLNTPTCTYNLTEGLPGTKEHDPEDYITKVTTVSPDNTGAAIWQDTLDLIFCGDKDLIDYVQRIVGMAVIPNNEAQFLETRKFQIEEIARLYRVPLHMIGDLEHATFSNIEHLSLEFVKYTLDPWIVRWEQGMQKALLSDSEKGRYFIKFNVEGLLRGDYASRMQGYATARQNGWMSCNDIRMLEDMNPIPDEEGGNLYLVNGSFTKLADAGAFAEKGEKVNE